jgi:4-hydroxy-3-methylbut-2-en-1-yl diphosphate synthase IspG/GcpE
MSGSGKKRDRAIRNHDRKSRAEFKKAVRIGVNWGSLDGDLSAQADG